jgi:2-polyprenyl-3-methyl-5-hydroxy-6-metoxy-1,4-benzoquinol methylase
MKRQQLTERQRREREYYETYSRLSAADTVSFAPVDGKQRRPWNSYWAFYERARGYFTSPAQRMLDFGCGAGEGSVRFAYVGFEVHGFDLSPSNIELAERRAKRYGYADRCHFSIQAAENLAYPTNWFDIVTGRDILHHVEIEPAIRQCLRVMKPGGVAIFREWVEAPVLDVLRRTIGAWLVPVGKSLERHVTEDERKLSAADLELICSLCPSFTLERFMLLSRFYRLLPHSPKPRPSLLEQIDWRLIQVLPWLSRLGGSALLTLRKGLSGVGGAPPEPLTVSEPPTLVTEPLKRALPPAQKALPRK